MTSAVAGDDAVRAAGTAAPRSPSASTVVPGHDQRQPAGRASAATRPARSPCAWITSDGPARSARRSARDGAASRGCGLAGISTGTNRAPDAVKPNCSLGRGRPAHDDLACRRRRASPRPARRRAARRRRCWRRAPAATRRDHPVRTGPPVCVDRPACRCDLPCGFSPGYSPGFRPGFSPASRPSSRRCRPACRPPDQPGLSPGGPARPAAAGRRAGPATLATATKTATTTTPDSMPCASAPATLGVPPPPVRASAMPDGGRGGEYRRDDPTERYGQRRPARPGRPGAPPAPAAARRAPASRPSWPAARRSTRSARGQPGGQADRRRAAAPPPADGVATAASRVSPRAYSARDSSANSP